MKQNERLLVYAVTGFLALILVVAVLFSRDPGKDAHGASTKPLDDLLGDSAPVAEKREKADDNRTGLPSPGEVAPQQPLAAAPKSMLAADLVAQQLGPSRRDRTVRFVRVKPNDSLETIVRRWCGARDPWLAETRSLNEELVVLRAGQEVAVPWVDDDVLLAALDAQKPRTLLAQDPLAPGTPGAVPPGPARDGMPAPSAPSFALPGDSGSGPAGSGTGSGTGATGATRTAALGPTTYTVKKGDALWRIAARTYGTKNADRMLAEIKAANPGLQPDTVREGQKIVLPKDPSAGG